MSGITTHVLDTSLGRPAAGVAVIISQDAGDGWREVDRTTTDEDGRAVLVGSEDIAGTGRFRVRFEVEEYFAARAVTAFYPSVDVVFEVADSGQHYHVPLLLSPFGYSTYRGS